jgi:hypothetical protein
LLDLVNTLQRSFSRLETIVDTQQSKIDEITATQKSHVTSIDGMIKNTLPSISLDLQQIKDFKLDSRLTTLEKINTDNNFLVSLKAMVDAKLVAEFDKFKT